MTNDIKRLSYEICSKNNIVIKCMETDKNHIHYMIELELTISVSKVIKLVKSYTTYHIWKKYNSYLKKTFWTDGYFVCTIGNVTETTIKEYINNQE